MSDPRGLRGRIYTPSTPRSRRHHVKRKGPLELHDPCRIAIADGGVPCSTCAWLADLDTPDARVVDAHTDDGEDV